MKPTLNEEIGMSQQGIDYVNSLEVKEHSIYYEALKNKPHGFKVIEKEEDNDFFIKQHEEYLEKQRIQEQARNAWICIFVIIAITVILNWKS